MRIAWVCPYPLNTLDHFSHLDVHSHPAPWLTLQAPRLAKHPEIELHVISVSKFIDRSHHFEENKVRFHFLNLARVPRVLLFYELDRRKILRCLDEIQPDLVHGFGTEVGYGYAAVASPYPSILMMQGVQSEIVRSFGVARWKRPYLMVPVMLERQTIRACRNFICETDFSARFVRSINSTANVDIMRMPVRPEFFSLQRRPSPSPTLLFVGSVIPEKGVEVLLHSLPGVLEVFPDATLRIIGHATPAYTQQLKSITQRLKIENNVQLYGLLDVGDLVRHFSEATVLVLSSYMDTAPNVIAEAHVAGVPTVATRVGGIPDMIEHEVTGLLVEPRSAKSLTRGILRLLQDPSFAQSLASAAQQRARALCDADTQVAKLVEVYRRVLLSSLTI